MKGEVPCCEYRNNGRWTTYEIKRKVDTSDRKVDTSDRKVDTSKNLTDNQEDKSKKAATSDRKVDTFNRKVDTSNKTRLDKEELENQIMQVCKSNYVRMEEVANTIGKSIDYLKNKIFPQMIKDGKLEKHFPYMHNHPKQGYKTAEKYAKKINDFTNPKS